MAFRCVNQNKTFLFLAQFIKKSEIFIVSKLWQPYDDGLPVWSGSGASSALSAGHRCGVKTKS
jgi:hypothetical protein